MMIIDFMCLYYTSFAGLLKRIKNSRGKKKSLSDLTKFSTLPSMPFRARKPSTNSRSSSSNLLKDERVKSMSESSTCSTLDSDSSSSPILNVCVIFTKNLFFFFLLDREIFFKREIRSISRICFDIFHFF